jgi:dynein heavy chain 2
METFVSRVLGLKELSPPALSLKNVSKETQSSEPVLIIISSGSDPSEELRELAQKTQQVLIHLVFNRKLF